MGKRDNQVEMSKRLAWFNELTKMMDDNAGQPIKSISAAEYLNILIDEGEIKPPPGEVKSWTEDKGASYKARNDWFNNMLKTVQKNGVTENSTTPGFDTKRKIFVDVIGQGFGDKGAVKHGTGTYLNPWASSIKFEDGRAVENTTDSFFTNGVIPGVPFYMSNRFSQESRDKKYELALSRAENVWGSAEEYVPISAWAGTTMTQKQARAAMPMYSQKPEDIIGIYDKKLLEDDIKYYKDNFKDLISSGQIPDGSSVDDYLAFESSGNIGKAFTYKAQAGDRDGFQFEDFESYKTATPEQLSAIQTRAAIERTKKILIHKMDYNEDQMKLSASNTAFGTGMLAIGLTLVSGGLFAASGATSSLASYAGMSNAAASGVLTGATVGAATGGTEGALKGAITGGLAGYATDLYNSAGGVEGITGLGDAAEIGSAVSGAPDLGNTTYNPLPTADAALAGDYGLTANTGNVFADNLGATIGASGALPDLSTIGTGAYDWADNLAESGINTASEGAADALVGNDPVSTTVQTPSGSSSSSGASAVIGGLTGGVFGNNRAKGKRFERSAATSAPYQFSGGINQNTSEPTGLLNEPQKRI